MGGMCGWGERVRARTLCCGPALEFAAGDLEIYNVLAVIDRATFLAPLFQEFPDFCGYKEH